MMCWAMLSCCSSWRLCASFLKIATASVEVGDRQHHGAALRYRAGLGDDPRPYWPLELAMCPLEVASVIHNAWRCWARRFVMVGLL